MNPPSNGEQLQVSKPLPTNRCAKCENQHSEYTLAYEEGLPFARKINRKSRTNRARNKKSVYPRCKKGQTKQ
jgi:hypothetical protein